MRAPLLLLLLAALLGIGAVVAAGSVDDTVPRTATAVAPASAVAQPTPLPRQAPAPQEGEPAPTGPSGPTGPESPTASAPAAPPPPESSGTRPASRALGRPFRRGRLLHGVQLPASGLHHLTWDAPLRRVPSRPWRRWGTDVLVALVLQVIAEHRTAHPEAPPILVGDLSRPTGGPFGAKYGGLGHASHQNGLDVDIYYPRKDRLPVEADRPSQVDRRLSQDLVDRFLAAGAQMVFVGRRVGLRGPKGRVLRIPHHDDHLHVRIPDPDGVGR